MVAKGSRKARKKPVAPVREQTQESDIQALAQHIRENPLLYVAGAAFVLICALAGGLYRTNEISKERALTSEYAQALETDDASLRAAELEQLAEREGPLAAEVLYMLGSAACEAEDFAKARAAFEQLRAEHPDSPFTPDAVEGLGYIAEDQGNYEAALASYREVRDKWPATFTALRQPFNIARCQERLGNVPEAIASYQEQLVVFHGSNISANAASALARLRKDHPELFPEPSSPEDELASALEALEVPAITTDMEPAAEISEEDAAVSEPLSATPSEEPLEAPSEDPAPVVDPAT